MRVFIVEDSPNMQVALKDLLLSVADAEVVAVAGSEALAIEWAEQHPGAWDLAIVDLMLEQGDGFSIVRRLKAQPMAGLVVVFSAYVTDVICRHCSAIGADAVFRKTESQQLASYVENLAGTATSS